MFKLQILHYGVQWTLDYFIVDVQYMGIDLSGLSTGVSEHRLYNPEVYSLLE